MGRVLCCAALAVAAGSFILLSPASALAQTAEKEPVIDAAPARVAYKAPATIKGHLEGWMAGDEVTLQRKRDGAWVAVADKPVDSDGRVRYELAARTRTADYRLAYIDPATELGTTSDPVRIRVRPRLTLNMSTTHVMRGRTVTLSGRLTHAPGRSVVLAQKVSGTWRNIGSAYVRDGRYALRFEAKHLGLRPLRATFRGDALNTKARQRKRLRVYNPALATWYGPGLYGNRTACGQRLGTSTVGVAHRSLQCGTKVAVLYRGRTVVVPVIDRGPYSRADWDLTKAAAERLRFYGTDTIGVHRTG